METFIISNEFFFYFSQLYTEKKEGKRGRQRERERNIHFPIFQRTVVWIPRRKKKSQINEMKSHRIRNRWKRYRIVFLGKYFNYDNEYFTEV